MYNHATHYRQQSQFSLWNVWVIRGASFHYVLLIG